MHFSRRKLIISSMDAKYIQNPSHDIFHTSVKYNAISETNHFANGKIYEQNLIEVPTKLRRKLFLHHSVP